LLLGVGESMMEVTQRTKDFVQSLQAPKLWEEADHVIVVSHGGTMKALLLNLCEQWIPGRTNADKLKALRNPKNCEWCCFQQPQQKPYSTDILLAECAFMKSKEQLDKEELLADEKVRDSKEELKLLKRIAEERTQSGERIGGQRSKKNVLQQVSLF
jgi:hypothetical protein